uniref:Cytosolic arginine sensor for mTORC1 subunit 2 n=1 Tax=Cebus imitator TaxID=2715852 RepID=A0A2K5RZQ0_CEBIM
MSRRGRGAGGRWNSTSWSTGCKLPASPRRVSRCSPTASSNLAFVSVCPSRCKFFSLTETPEDYTIIVDEEGFLELPSSEHLSVADATWLALNVVSGGGSFSSSQPIGVTKIAKSVIAPLADQNISVFMLSTYQTDFILSRGRSSTRCPVRATGSASPAWTPTRCLLSPHSSWT